MREGLKPATLTEKTTMGEYHGDFTSWADVREQFEPNWKGYNNDFRRGRQKPVPPTEPEDVLYAEYDQPGYEGSALVIYRQGDRVFEVTGSHCSCYGLEDQWEPEEYDIPTYLAFVARTRDGYGINDKGRAVAAAKLKLLING